MKASGARIERPTSANRRHFLWELRPYFRQVAGQLFVSGAAYTDVKQGSIGDCYYLCALAETALRSNSTITSMPTMA